MHTRVTWTDALDARLCALRLAGVTWDAIGQVMGLSRNTVLERGRKIGARQRRPAMPAAFMEHKDRPARQAGHPETWGLITQGTVLDGEPYPYPVFL